MADAYRYVCTYCGDVERTIVWKGRVAICGKCRSRSNFDTVITMKEYVGQREKEEGE